MQEAAFQGDPLPLPVAVLCARLGAHWQLSESQGFQVKGIFTPEISTQSAHTHTHTHTHTHRDTHTQSAH